MVKKTHSGTFGFWSEEFMGGTRQTVPAAASRLRRHPAHERLWRTTWRDLQRGQFVRRSAVRHKGKGGRIKSEVVPGWNRPQVVAAR